jgi:hypothetical protein
LKFRNLTVEDQFNENRDNFHHINERFLNNDFLYSIIHLNNERRDFCGRLLSFIAQDYKFIPRGAEALFEKMRDVERLSKKMNFT